MRTDEDQINYGNKRDLELENLVGNLLIAEYQVDRLRTRLGDIVNRYRPQKRQNNASTHVFKHLMLRLLPILLRKNLTTTDLFTRSYTHTSQVKCIVLQQVKAVLAAVT